MLWSCWWHRVILQMNDFTSPSRFSSAPLGAPVNPKEGGSPKWNSEGATVLFETRWDFYSWYCSYVIAIQDTVFFFQIWPEEAVQYSHVILQAETFWSFRNHLDGSPPPPPPWAIHHWNPQQSWSPRNRDSRPGDLPKGPSLMQGTWLTGLPGHPARQQTLRVRLRQGQTSPRSPGGRNPRNPLLAGPHYHPLGRPRAEPLL